MTDQRPTVVAFLGHQTLGDFCWQTLTATSIAAKLGGARLGIIYRDDRPYKTPLLRMAPLVSARLAVPNNAKAWLPLDWFDPDCPDAAWPQDWIDQGLHRPDLFLTPSMLANIIIPPVPSLVIPPEMDKLLADMLVRSGVDPSRWFACLHMRELGYVYRRDTDGKRCVKPHSYLPMIRDILVRGGQVVRLGDPTMTPLPPLRGLIDLSRVADSFLLQAYAMSRARFFIGTDSGTTQLASAFKIPAASTNALGVGVWNDGDVILTKTLYSRDRRRLTNEDLRSTGMLSLHWYRLPDMEVEDNSPEQLIAVARHMHGLTKDCTRWRQPCAGAVLEGDAAIRLPLQQRDIAEQANLTWWGE